MYSAMDELTTSLVPEIQNGNDGLGLEFARPLKDMDANHAASQKRSYSEMNSGGSDLGTDILDLDARELRAFIERLENRAKQLSQTEQKPKNQKRFQVLYRIREEKTVPRERSDIYIPMAQSRRERKTVQTSGPYFDKPEWVRGQDKHDTLRCRTPVDNFELYLEKNKNISFLVYRTYALESAVETKQSHPPKRDSQPDVVVEETVQPVSESLIEAIEALLESREEYSNLQEEFKKTFELSAPYLFIYHRRKAIDDFLGGLSTVAKEELTIFWDYVVQTYGDEYAAADALISKGRIALKYIRYLFKPGDVVIERDKKEYRGWMTKSWAHIPVTLQGPVSKGPGGHQPPPRPLFANPPENSRGRKWEIQAWRWDYDGVDFQQREGILELSIPHNKSGKPDSGIESADRLTEEIAITQLEVFPIQHADAELVEKLRRRGRTFWRCRNKALVSYQETDISGTENLVSALNKSASLAESTPANMTPRLRKDT